MVQIKFSIEPHVKEAIDKEYERRGGHALSPLLREIFMIGYITWKKRQTNRHAILKKLEWLESLEIK